MALTDSNDEQLIESKTETRSPLGIDLNEIPTCCFAETLVMPEPEVDSIDVVRAFHDNPDPAPGPPAALPWGGWAAACGACGRPETGDAVMVCDGCERGFHLECAGIIGLQAPSLADWLCRECVSGGVRNKRWPLGVKSKRILDINASPPSDVDCDGSEEVQDLRKHASGDNSYGGNAFGAPVTHSNFVYAGKEFGCQKASGIISHTAEGFDNLFASCTMDRSFKEVGSGFQQGRLRSGNNAVIRFPSQNAGEVYLQALRQFISERHGVLEEGWHVELKHSLNSYGLHAVYYAPDGQTFGSMYEVAHYLGLMSNQSSVDSEIRTEGSPLQERLYLPRKRKLTRFPAYGFSENKETLLSSYCEEIPPNDHNMGICAIKSDNFMKATESGTVGNGGIVSEQNKGGFPVQFEDFFILSLGQVKTRPSYHDVNLICPVGYRSCWHDKITGSLFTCEVLDGGDSGPVFKVQRSSCTALAVPTGSTVLLWSNLGHGQNNEKRDVISDFNCGSDNDANIQMILSDPCPPQENDILICFGDSNHVQAFESSQLEAGSLLDNNGNPLFHNLESRDEIGVISVEDRSPYAAWRMMSQKFIELCSDMCKRKGKLKFLCKHVGRETGSVNWNVLDECNKLRFASLAKFCSSQAPHSIPFECQDDEENGTQANMLSNWLDQDRFGLDADFVQEMIEQLPGVEACLRYEFLKNRSSYSASVTVGNGLLIVRRKAGENMKEEGLDGFLGTFERPRLGDDHVMDDYHPPGKPLCLRLPPEHTGDFHEVWEFFSRFHDILGLKEAFASHELEEELINPWFDRSILNDKLEKEIQGTEVVNLHRTHGVGKEMVATSNKSRVVVSKENPHAFIQMETEATKAAAESRLASVTYSRCFGVALTKAHISLLKVLICELQSKVAAFADRNFDSGEIRSRRGRKKDFDSFLPSRRIKINMLPVNELTWPELVRRYILAVSSMDGNLESAEITARESGKVLRCLQGDGGVLCGSLTGVAGMEADAILLAEATKKIFGSLNIDDDILTIEDEAHDVTGAHEKNVNGANIPEWAQMLEPVRKLPTNVGTRIRKCVYDALEKGPPEWARKILEHSISKEVYKGNASGPTKKAVLSVLADVRSEGLVQKSDRGNNKKIVVPVSDIIMKQCRIVLRRAAAADDAKIFCNLLGRKLMNSTDNDDEGLLGSPGMVSRPLDFRTIDLRLAVGAYGRSHEAFLEDVRELWNNVRTAYADQHDFVELAETLSQNFESLYEAEVIALVQKLVGYSKLESLSVETRKEINDILASTSEIPKAPWDEGVCKVCGIDKDDDSVLLCDTCDAEYHMYCLNPPLARIPEGNWYCPSCCVGKPVVQGASECSKVISQRGGKKYQGEVTRVCLEALTQVAAAMEEKEYWDFSLQERIFLLKFLCDELLNSALVRQHLEQCVETTPESQQKLRSFSVEWKNLKSREDFLAARVVQGDENMLNAVGETGVKEGLATGFTNHGSCIGQLQNLSDGTNNLSISYDDPPTQEGGQEGSHINCSSKHPFATYSEKNHAYKNQHRNSLDSEILQDAHTVTVDSNVSSSKSEKSSGLNELPWSNPLSQEIDKSSSHIDIQGDLQDCMGKDVSSAASLPSDHHALCLPSGVVNLEAVQGVPSVAANESQAYQLELDTIKGEIRHLQGSITCLESQLLKQSVRREFLGSDSGGRLYWISATPGGHPRIIVDGSLQQRKKLLHTEHSVKKFSGLRSCASSCTDTGFNLVGSKASCPFLYDINNASATCSRWTFYQTDAEIEALINWLKDSEPKERELKESILNWQKQRFWDSQHSRNHVESPPQTALAMPDNCEKVDFSNCLVTKAAVLLEKRYGPCSELEGDTSRKQGETTKLTNEGKMHRCECLEPIWPSRSHCSLCHKTFSNNAEFEEHNNGRCTPGPPANKKSKEVSDSLKGKGNLMPENPWEECFVEKDKVETSKHGCSKFNSRLIKFQNEESACPYDFEDVCRKFVTKDSNKELVQEIGLIGSSGIPSFVSSLSPFLSDSTLTLITQKEASSSGDEVRSAEMLAFSQGNRNATSTGHDGTPERSSRRSGANDVGEVLKVSEPALGCSEQRDRKPYLDSHSLDRGVASCCVVPQTSLRPLVGKVSHISRRLKINLLDMDAVLPEEALRPSKAHLERRRAWRTFVKSAETIYEIVQATFVLEDMIKTEYLRNEWWYWSSLSAAVKISTLSSLSLRIYSLDAAIVYEKASSDLHLVDNLKPSSILDQKLLPALDMPEKYRATRKSSKKRKDPAG